MDPASLVRFGPFEVDLRSGSLRKYGTAIKLQEQPAKILVALLERPGEVVPREVLEKLLWPEGLFVDFEAGLNAAINRLRRALSDSAEKPRYVETVARKGYRFIAPVETHAIAPAPAPIAADMEQPAKPMPATQVPSPGTAHPWRIGALSFGIAVLALGGAASWHGVRTVRESRIRAPNAPVRLTYDSFSIDPFINKEGNLVVYASDRAGQGDLDLWLQPVSSKEARRLTTDTVDESEPAISPNNSQIAFRSERDGGGIYSMPLLGGTPELLAARGRRPRFSPDGSQIAYSTSNVSYYLQAKGSGAAYVIPSYGGTPVPIAPQFDSSHFPLYSPDGTHILFLGAESQKRGSLDWWVVPATGGVPVQTKLLTTLQNSGLRSDGRTPILIDAWQGEHLFFSARSGDELNLWRIALSPSGQAVGKPERVTYGAATEIQPSVSGSGAIVFSTAAPNIELAAVPLAAETGTSEGPLQVLAPSAAPDIWPTVTADGHKVLFHSSRTGRRALYLYDVEAAAAATELLFFPNIRAWSQISPDGKSFVYHRDSQCCYDAFEQPVGGGDPIRLCEACLYMGRTRDRKTIISTSIRGPLHISRHDIATGNQSVYLKSKNGVGQPMLSPDERWVAFCQRNGPDRARIYLAPWAARSEVPEKEWIPVTDGSSHDTSPVWSIQGNVLYFASDRDGFSCIWGQRIAKGNNPLQGQPFPVRHLHRASERAGNLGVSSRGFAVAMDKLVLTIFHRRGNIWLFK